ncbi:thiol reductant ABC exporter subunit CydD [Bacillus wiedmannii]|jgi:ATP-binding cassette subfamily C protein CydD|uniref:Transport ATP-binding protein cydD n=1 Tax=Bacillus thuringiensis TaxID=1428 RepID=A0A1C4CLW0_BACTU|nr:MULTISPECIES: thiol reductant ABC exporter subunit CydD [Bacillus]AZJ20123.1 thiol reductant ABC exporter subunit CydD [Bacillus wiedmannii bv. thuringiensis]MBJ8112306.1 thiol reductant ABC exporter subunit CydD [Bacillus cereus group sp. N6]MCC2324107.1 thiol reductant ABC exporter subunit CydD [Bacillus wiedmannii]MCU5331234.1 thiol reductant ABC exporter subunit CydD [Bacillus wiedmannii]MCU5500523.1 thiol reductant ABC exporter subunit CydD [Bacillus wiedmannii]
MKRKRGLPSYPGSRVLYVVLTIISILEAISIIGQTVFLARAITFLFQGETVQSVLNETVYFGITFAVRHMLVRISQILVERFAEKTGSLLRKQLIEAYFTLGPRYVQTAGTGHLVTLSIEGIEKFKTYIELTIPKMIRSSIVPGLIVLYVFTLDIESGIILVVTIPIVITFMILLGLAAQKMADSQYETYRVLSNHFVDTLKGLETLKYLGKSKQHEGKIEKVSKRYRKATMRTLRVAFLSSFALDFFTSLSIAFVAVGLGIRLIDGTIVLLPALTILILAPEYFLPIKQVGANYHATLDGQLAMEQIEEILQQQKEIGTKESNVGLIWNASSNLKLQDVKVKNNESEKAILEGIDFTWKGTGAIGVIGESGAGKSTLIDVLAGFLTPSGGKLIINGVKIDGSTREDWQKNIAYIPQQPYIFPLSLKDNICFYETNTTDAEVERVINEVGLRSLVTSLPNGMYERIGEGGRMLSGGQEQRVAMARALLSKKPIILLDEPTAHLDIETEFEIKQAMLRLFEGKLVFLATHRLHWMKQMDHILILNKGEMIKSGTYEELLKNEALHFQRKERG